MIFQYIVEIHRNIHAHCNSMWGLYVDKIIFPKEKKKEQRLIQQWDCIIETTVA